MFRKLFKKLFRKEDANIAEIELSPERMAELLEEAISLGYIRVEPKESVDASQFES